MLTDLAVTAFLLFYTLLQFARNPFQSAGCFAILTGVLKNKTSPLIELNFEAGFFILLFSLDLTR